MCVRAVVWLPHQMLKSTFIEIFRKTFRILAQLCDVRMVYLTFMLNACFTYRNNYAWNYSTPSHSAKNGPQKKSSLSEVFQTLEILQSITSKSEKKRTIARIIDALNEFPAPVIKTALVRGLHYVKSHYARDCCNKNVFEKD